MIEDTPSQGLSAVESLQTIVDVGQHVVALIRIARQHPLFSLACLLTNAPMRKRIPHDWTTKELAEAVPPKPGVDESTVRRWR